MRKQRWLGLLLVLVVLVTAGCEAPLKPKSKRAESAPSASPAPPAKPDDASPTPGSVASATARPKPSAKTTIDVPKVEIPKATGPLLGGDVSWPQCPKGMGIPEKRSTGSPMPVAAARYVILGLTNGPGFYPNPCLASQTSWVRSRHLMAAAYSVISAPRTGDVEIYGNNGPFDKSTETGQLSNVGYQQAKFNLTTMKRAGLQSPIIWLDVEPVPKFDWPPDTRANAAVVRGAARGYTDAGFRVGAYSTQALWQHVVGDLRLGVPEWRAAGQTSKAEALRRCGNDRMFQGGRSVLGQWVEAGRDMNITCPGTTAELARWFHQY
jgi:hypothetical protein